MSIAPLRFVVLALAAGACWTSTPSAAQDRTCADLWYRRNAEYKAAGYCFRTPDGIRAFGNAGCAYDDVAEVPLSRGQRATVAAIVARERELGCR